MVEYAGPLHFICTSHNGNSKQVNYIKFRVQSHFIAAIQGTTEFREIKTCGYEIRKRYVRTIKNYRLVKLGGEYRLLTVLLQVVSLAGKPGYFITVVAEVVNNIAGNSAAAV